MGISLADNKLDVIPSILVTLESLKELNVSGNHLGPRLLLQQRLDTEFEFTKPLTLSLEVLDLSRNAIEHLPQSLSSIANLRSLQLSSNALRDLPDNLVALQRLSTLDVARNELCYVNSAVFGLPRLTDLILTGNPIDVAVLERS